MTTLNSLNKDLTPLTLASEYVKKCQKDEQNRIQGDVSRMFNQLSIGSLFIIGGIYATCKILLIKINENKEKCHEVSPQHQSSPKKTLKKKNISFIDLFIGMAIASLAVGVSQVYFGVMGLKYPQDHKTRLCKYLEGFPKTGECKDEIKYIVDSSGGKSQKVINIFGGVEKFCELPELAWNDRFYKRNTNGIDEVQSKDVTQRVMRGVDRALRPYVAFRICTSKPNATDTATKYCNEENRGVMTLFQEGTHEGSKWLYGANYGVNFGGRGSTEQNIITLKDLFEKGESTKGNFTIYTV